MTTSSLPLVEILPPERGRGFGKPCHSSLRWRWICRNGLFLSLFPFQFFFSNLCLSFGFNFCPFFHHFLTHSQIHCRRFFRFFLLNLRQSLTCCTIGCFFATNLFVTPCAFVSHHSPTKDFGWGFITGQRRITCPRGRADPTLGCLHTYCLDTGTHRERMRVRN